MAVLAAQRRTRIVTELRRHGSVRVTELAAMLDVSEMTIRRDLDGLDHEGEAVKVHGGATLPGTALAGSAARTDEPGFAAKSTRQLAEKRAIAAAAIRFVRPGMAIGISAGTTTWVLAQQLGDVDQLTVVTNSIRIADALDAAGPDGPETVLTGGVRTPSDALVGPVAVAALRHLHLDLVFLGVHGMAEHAGFTTPNLLEAETNRAMIDAAARLVVVADHTKWGTVGLSSMAGLEQADVLVTDAGLPSEARAVLGERVGTLLVADRVAR